MGQVHNRRLAGGWQRRDPSSIGACMRDGDGSGGQGGRVVGEQVLPRRAQVGDTPESEPYGASAGGAGGGG